MGTRIVFYGLVVGVLLVGAYRILTQNHKVEEGRVVVSIMPLHMLARDIMEGVGEPHLLIKNKMSPHDFHLKPSDAALFHSAKVVFWIGQALEHGLKNPLRTLPKGVPVVEMMEQEGIKIQNRMQHAHEHHGGHTHEGLRDPHIWLDPDNAIRMAEIMRDTLIKLDPSHKQAYTKNTSRLVEKIRKASAKIVRDLGDSQGKEFAVFHNAYQYFQRYFGLRPFKALTLNPEQSLKIKGLREVRKAIEANHIRCLFTEPQFSRKGVEALRAETAVSVAVLDPLGREEISYVELLERLGHTIKNCHKG